MNEESVATTADEVERLVAKANEALRTGDINPALRTEVEWTRSELVAALNRLKARPRATTGKALREQMLHELRCTRLVNDLTYSLLDFAAWENSL